MSDNEVSTPARLAQWERRTEWVLAALAAAFLAAYAWPILEPAMSRGMNRALDRVDLAIWVLFGVDYATRVYLAHPNRGIYVWRHLPDLAILALPVLRPLRLLRLLVLLKALNRRAADGLRGRIGIYTAGAVAVILFCGALAVLDAERGKPQANIETFGDALWWAATTITTVGYGDHFPVTFQGRLVAIGLMLGGIALLGVVTASFASWLIDKVREQDELTQAATRADLAALTREVAALRDALEKQRN